MNKKDSFKSNEAAEISSKSPNMKVDNRKEPEKLEEETSEKNQNIGLSLAEKAMLVASPVVPTKEGGEVDQERSNYSTHICLRYLELS